MLSQTATEASLSAIYVENYLDCVENVPNDLQRHLSRLRELDVTFRECVRKVKIHTAILKGPNTEESRRCRSAMRLQSTLSIAQEIGDEQLQLVQLVQDMIYNKLQSLDTDHKKLISCLEGHANGPAKKEPTPPIETLRSRDKETTPEQPEPQEASPPSPDCSTEKELDKSERDKSGERLSKRARRSRGTTGTTTDGADSSERDSERQAHSTNKKGIGKKKKRKSRHTPRSETPPEEADPIDPDEPRYCLCDQISFGEMILCDNDLCPIEWFHFSCVSLTTKPKGKWFCPKCRGDRPNIMKPKGQFLKELERFNREKEEKA